MRNLTKFTLFLLLFAVFPTMAAEFIQGRVIAINRDTGVMELQLSENAHDSYDRNEPLKLSEKRLTIRIDPTRLPPCVREGGYILVWGDYLNNQPFDFQAQTIRGGCYRRGCDPTGVRERLGKCLKKGRGYGRGRRWRHRRRCGWQAPPDDTSEQNGSSTYEPAK